MVKLLKKENYILMPWKNDLGNTLEIAIDPPAAQFPKDPFVWRLSSAVVGGDNTFSNFDGYDRLLMVWKGEGFILNGEKREQHQPFAFSGEAVVHCKLIGSQVTDLGLIYKRDQIQAKMDFYKVLSGTRQLTLELHYLVLLNGNMRVNSIAVNEGDTLLVKDEEHLTFEPSADACVAQISIRPKRQ